MPSSAPSTAGVAPEGSSGPEPRPADAEADAAYYRQQAPALAREDANALAALDSKRLRRGRLYVGNLGYPKELDEEVRAAIKRTDDPAVLAAATKMLALDVTDIEAHTLAFVVNDRAGNASSASFHRELAGRLLESIRASGDGRDFGTAWVVFQVREEYQVLRAADFEVLGQSLVPHAGRHFDVLEASERPGMKARFYFDVTELFAEEGRSVGGP